MVLNQSGSLTHLGFHFHFQISRGTWLVLNQPPEAQICSGIFRWGKCSEQPFLRSTYLCRCYKLAISTLSLLHSTKYHSIPQHTRHWTEAAGGEATLLSLQVLKNLLSASPTWLRADLQPHLTRFAPLIPLSPTVSWLDKTSHWFSNTTCHNLMRFQICSFARIVNLPIFILLLSNIFILLLCHITVMSICLRNDCYASLLTPTSSKIPTLWIGALKTKNSRKRENRDCSLIWSKSPGSPWRMS